MSDQIYSVMGYCPICCCATTFIASTDWYRDSLTCVNCTGGSLPRERALALVLNELKPDWKRACLHESSPGAGGLSAVLASQCAKYTPTHYFPKLAPGANGPGGVRNENLEQQTFDSDQFDLVITQDVMEHVFDPASAYREIYRTLKDGGLYLHTFPIRKWMADPISQRAQYQDGQVVHLAPPEYHGNPIDEKGALVTFDYGYDVHGWIASQAPFDVRVYRFRDAYHGIIGEYTDVVACFKRMKR